MNKMLFSPLRAVALAAALSVTVAPAQQALAHGMQTADLVQRVSPAVVNIFTTQAVRPRQQLRELPIPEGHPLRDFFERFGGQGAGSGEPQESLGSGFIFDPQGFVITNHHVIDGAATIKLRLSDEREFEARVIGSDKLTDIALLKIDTAQPLPYVSLGDSARIRVGEDVVAVGNSFGLGTAITKGIISAKGRDIRLSGPYVDYIQTDAAINRGNSGGPLFDANGQVIGVNTAIFSPSGGSVGVGFAVPSNLVAEIVADLRVDGDVDRGWLGVSIQPVTDAIATALGLDRARGAMVASVDQSGPSYGVLREGDVILDFNNSAIEKSRDLPRVVARSSANSSAPVRILRDRVEQLVTIRVGTAQKRTSDAALAPSYAPSYAPYQPPAEAGRLGAQLASISPNQRAQFGLAPGETGAVVLDVAPDSAARRSGLERGDVILQIGDRVISAPADVMAALESVYSASALFRIKRDGRNIYIGVTLT